MSEPVLRVVNLCCPLVIEGKTHFVAQDLNFELYLGKTLAIVGESGCGKTLTALSILRCLPEPPCLPPTGEVLYRGQNLLALSEKEMRQIRGGKIAMIFQDPQSALNPVYTIGWQLREAIGLHLSLYDEEADIRAVLALEEVGIADPQILMNSYPHQLSGGMKQRVMIAIALVAEPDILIADEPTTALDVTIQKQVLDLIVSLQKKKGMALLLITHDMGVVAEVADEVLVMYTAQSVERGDVFQIFHRPAHPYTLGLFSSRPNPEKPRTALQPIQGFVPPLGRYPKGCRFHPRCPFKMKKCETTEVPNFSVEKGHLSRCLLHDGTEESRQRGGEVFY